jgi:hypothetical protein
VKVVADDARLRQRATDRLTVAIGGIDRDHLDARPNLVGQRAQPALHRAPVAPVEHLHDATAVQIRDDGGQLTAAAVMGLIERQATRPAVDVTRRALADALTKRTSDLIAAGALLARDLGMRGTVPDALGQPPAEAPGHALTRGQLLMRLGKRAPAVSAPVAALAPHQPRQLPGDRQVAHPHARTLLDAHLAAAAIGAAGRPRGEGDR